MPDTTILIVEDEIITAMDLGHKLGRLGYTVCGIAARGDDALALVRQHHPHLVLMDIRLAGEMDGVETAEQVRREHDVPVIYLTAHADRATLDRAKLTEPFGYLLKPFEERELATHIEMALYKHQAERRLRESEERWRVTLGSIGDAVIASDTSGCITFLNPVAAVLTGWEPAEALGRPITQVFHIINERSHQPAENLVSRVLRENRVVELANHTALITRDGREVPVEDSAAPITDTKGQVTGVVIVFHDVTEKRRAEEALRESETRFRTLFTSLNEGFYLSEIIYDGEEKPCDYRYLEVNPAFAQIIGLPREQIIGRTFKELVPNLNAQWLDIFVRVAQTGIPAHDTFYSAVFQRHFETCAFCPKNGQFAVLVTDITERKLAEQAMEKTNRALRAYGQSNQALLRATDETAYLHEVCQIIVEDCGHPLVWVGFAENDADKSVRLVAHAGFDEGYVDTLRLSWADTDRGRGPTGVAIRTGQVAYCRNMLTDAAFLPWREQALCRGYAASLVLPLLADGRAFGALAIYFREPDPFTDEEITLLNRLASDCAFGITTLRLRAEHARAEAERANLLVEVQRQAAELDAAIGSIADGLIIYDAGGHVVRMSPAAAEVLGYTEADRGGHVVERQARLHIERADGSPFPAEELPTMRALRGETVRGEILIMKQQQRTLWLSVSAAPITGVDDHRLGVILTASDITELHAMQEQMKTFVQLVSHDLRAPLTITQGYVSILRDSLAESGDDLVRTSIEAISRAVKRMDVMIEDLTMAARLEGGQLPLTPTTLDLDTWLPEFLTRSAHALEMQRVRVDLPATLPALTADTDRLERILMNLISNALKYSDPGTYVWLRAQHAGDAVRIAIHDQGQGIAPNDLSNLFEKFYRANSSRKAEGIGLGLYLTRLMVEAHGGSIHVESEVGRGSTFAFTLPAAKM